MNYRKMILGGTCAALMGLSFAQGAQTGETLKATPTLVDFGTIDEGQAAVATAKIENVGSAPVEITGVRTS